ncbi:MAG: putative porin, partial [candidate division Zixibacteria bacterium]|nr:putative porin [candidate division Zixibacteria bacterium]
MRILLIILTGLTLLSPLTNAGEWWESVKVKGDLRYRHEMIDTENKDAYHRHRLRARLAVEGQVSATTKVGIQLATGLDDPVSTNQTLTGSFSSKSVVLDMAYFDYKPTALPELKITAGKFHNPFFKPGSSELIWDSDFNPEGGVATFSKDFEDITLTLIGSGLWIEERSSNDDSWMGAGQGVFRYNINDKKSSITLGAGFFNYVNTVGFAPFYDGKDKG